MSGVVDARGLSCPQPVLMTLNAIRKGDANQLVVLVDTDTSRENVSRMAASQGWQVTHVEEQDGGYRIAIARNPRRSIRKQSQ